MERYVYSPEVRATLEKLEQPLAIYQAIDKRVVSIVLSDGFCKLFGYADRNRAMYDMDHDMYRDTHPDDRERIAKAALDFARAGDDSVYDVVYRTRAGVDSEWQVIHAHGVHFYPETGVRLAQVWYMHEGAYAEGEESSVTGLNKALNSALHEESILKAAHYDVLTGLPNLAYFFLRCDIEKVRVFSEGKQGALVYMDLDGMKYFNHHYSFTEGSNLLKAFAQAMQSIFGRDDCCHIAADRFAVSTTADRVEDQLKQLFAEAEKLNGGNSLPIKAGIYTTALEDVPVSTAYDRAKLACDQIGKITASTIYYYNKKMSSAIRWRQYIEQNIDKAIANKWITVYYQPIVRAINGRVCSEEALARWIDPKEGFLSPADFIPHLENAGLIYRLDLCMLEQVLEKIHKQMDAGLHIVPQSINLSRSDFTSCDIVEEIRKRVDVSGIRREYICIEVTESVIGSDVEFMKKQVERFRSLGFPVWMDDFGSGYSSIDVLQSIRFDLIKFDMSFMRKLDEGDAGKIILTELLKMATSLDLDTVCEGVETETQLRFLQEIGCSKLQGFYFCKPIPFEGIVERYEKGIQIGFEDPKTSEYYDAIGRVNLYDLDVIATQDDDSFQNAFNTLPMAIAEIRGEKARFVRSNPSYRDFIRRSFGIDMSKMPKDFFKFNAAFMNNVVRNCCEQGLRAFFDEKMRDGSVVHSFARKVGVNPATGDLAVFIAVLSISDPNDGESYADIARALASDYYNIYVVDLDTENFIEYSSKRGREELAEERHGTSFFAASREAALTRIYEEDRAGFLGLFTKENVLKTLDEQGMFATTYRLMDTGVPMFVNMKIMRLRETNRIIVGFSIIDAQVKQRKLMENVQKERDALARVMAITEDYLSLYSVDPETGHYVEYTATSEYETLGFAKEGKDFFRQGIDDGIKTVYYEDLSKYLEEFRKESILEKLKEEGRFVMHYRLVIQGGPKQVSLKIVPFHDGEKEILLAGVRNWRARGGDK